MTTPTSGSASSEPKQKKVRQPVITQFRLDLYNAKGEIRPSFPKEVVRNQIAQYGDVLRAISSNQWHTMDELVEAYWELERRFKWDSRTRKSIESAINDLVSSGIVIVR